jgi:hypothetical protein
MGANRLSRIVPPSEHASPLPLQSATLARRREDEGDKLVDQGYTSSRVCFRQDMRPVARVDIIGQQFTRAGVQVI